MITKPEHKILIGQIANIYCKDQENKNICVASLKERMLNIFTNESFSFFLQNFQIGRFWILQYSDWKDDGTCKFNARKYKINIKLTDVITGEVKTGIWRYNGICGFYNFVDLNKLIGTYKRQLLDAPISSNNNSDITKPRLIYGSQDRPNYNIVLIPPLPGGGGGGFIPTPPNVPNTPNLPNAPAGSGFNLSTLITPTTALIAAGILAVYLFTKK